MQTMMYTTTSCQIRTVCSSTLSPPSVHCRLLQPSSTCASYYPQDWLIPCVRRDCVLFTSLPRSAVHSLRIQTLHLAVSPLSVFYAIAQEISLCGNLDTGCDYELCLHPIVETIVMRMVEVFPQFIAPIPDKSSILESLEAHHEESLPVDQTRTLCNYARRLGFQKVPF
jgi:hypothetical protein